MTGRRATTAGPPAVMAELTVPARPAERGRRKFGATWWGRAWLAALEQQAGLDPKRLSRGRGYARSGAVGDAVVRPGSVTAPVTGRRPQPYRVGLTVPTFTDADWDRALAVIGGRLGHTAALLSGELPAEVVDDVRAAGLSLLPGPHDLSVSCSCPDWAVPCKHSAALCMVMADVLDEDPFAALLLRGRARDAVLAELRRQRNAAGRRTRPPGGGAGAGPESGSGPGVGRPPPAGVPAAGAYQRDRPALPRPLPPPDHPGVPPELPPSRLVDVPAIARLAAGAAEQAHRLRAGDTLAGDTGDTGDTGDGGDSGDSGGAGGPAGAGGQNPP